MRIVSRRQTALAAGVLATLASGCPPSTSSTGTLGLAGQEAFLCCTTRFNLQRHASDANYDYRDKTVFPAGTRVRVVSIDDHSAVVQPDGDSATYSLIFRYGRRAMRPRDYFERVLLTEDPTRNVSEREFAAIRDGRLAVGMSKWEAITARGFPPAHRTPSLDADEWLYYANHKLCERVRFANDRIVSVEAVPPPG
jgi:hypothetical protein